MPSGLITSLSQVAVSTMKGVMITTIPQPSCGPGSVWAHHIGKPTAVSAVMIPEVRVGLATDRAVRTSLVVVSVTLLVALAIYGRSGNSNLSG
jgi:hypothetical protein